MQWFGNHKRIDLSRADLFTWGYSAVFCAVLDPFSGAVGEQLPPRAPNVPSQPLCQLAIPVSRPPS